MKKIILLALIFILSACSTSTEFDKNLTKWNDANISHYRFQVGVSCFCPFGNKMPIMIEVKNGNVVSLIDVTGNAIVESDPIREMLNQYQTIDRLFISLEQSIKEAEEIQVDYDEMYGFPSSIAIDYITEAADDEIWVDVSNFEILK